MSLISSYPLTIEVQGMTIVYEKIEQAKGGYEHCKKRKNLPTSIALVGAQNATKSSLANALTGHAEGGFFAVGEGRVTQKIKSFEVGGKLYIDTAGTGFSNGDDSSALDAYDKADVFLMAHRIDSGELDAHEMNWLSEFLAVRKSDLMIALTASDMKDDQEQLKIKSKIQEQLISLDMAETPVISVSCNRYNAGVEFSSAEFIQLSGVEILQRQISKSCKHVDASRSRKVEKARAYLLRTIDDQKALLNDKKSSVIQEQKTHNKDLKRAVEFIAQTYS